MDDPIAEAAREATMAIAERLELAVEQAVLTGEYGVLVLTDSLGLPFACGVSATVPYGHIHWRPGSRDEL